MAGDWIPMRLDLADDPAVGLIADALNLDEDTIIGKLHRLWSWANAQSRDGRDISATLARLDVRARCDGFAGAMVAVGWLVSNGDSVTFPRFDRWNSKSAKARLLNTRRQQGRRANATVGARQKRDKSATEARQKRDQGATREEKSIKETTTTTTSSPPDATGLPLPSRPGGSETDVVVALLEERGINKSIAADLAGSYTPARIRAVLDAAIQQGKYTGWIVSALRGNWSLHVSTARAERGPGACGETNAQMDAAKTQRSDEAASAKASLALAIAAILAVPPDAQAAAYKAVADQYGKIPKRWKASMVWVWRIRKALEAPAAQEQPSMFGG